MKHTLFALAALLLLLNSCFTEKNFPLKYEYQEGPKSIVIEKPLDTVWSRVIDFFAYSGFSITNMDKASGLIVTGEYDFTHSITTEDVDGNLFDKKAFMVYESKTLFGMDAYPSQASANFTVRVKPIEYNKTELSICLVNMVVKHVHHSEYGTTIYNFKATSSGRFEKLLVKAINR